MGKYNITIKVTEIRERFVTVESDNEKDAKLAAAVKYDEGRIPLTDNNIVQVKYSVGYVQLINKKNEKLNKGV